MAKEPQTNGTTGSTLTTRTADGWALVADVSVPPTPRAVAVLGHAMMVDRRTMDRPRGQGLMSALTEAGIAVLSFDLRGHGESGPNALDGARYSYDDFVRQDIPAMVAAARLKFPNLPVTVVGHSLAGHAAMIAAGLSRATAPDAIVGLAPNLWAPRFEPSRRVRMKKSLALGAMAAMTAPTGSFDSRLFRMGVAAEPWSYLRGFVRFWLSDELTSDDGCDDYVRALGEAVLPVLVISSANDQLLARPVSVALFAATMGRCRLSHRILEGKGAPDHMGLVTDPESRFLWRDIAQWILALDIEGEQPVSDT
ncbi:MAG: alpha/beta fold hydrolase [Deltaproteobacteria bacterium]|nr:alpha/beta fold hydrolase [Deltaproteobacteria bacterium]